MAVGGQEVSEQRYLKYGPKRKIQSYLARGYANIGGDKTRS